MDLGKNTLRWRVNRRLPALKLAAAAVFALLGFFLARDVVSRTLAGVAAVGIALSAVRDLAVPVRLSADPAGVTMVVGVARRLRLPWSRIERVRVDRRQRLGLRSELLEIDAGDTVHLFSGYDLDASPAEAAEALNRLRPDPARH